MRKMLRRLALILAALFGFASNGGVPKEINPANICKACGTAALAEEQLASSNSPDTRCQECGRLIRAEK